jgi:hypothetical protein
MNRSKTPTDTLDIIATMLANRLPGAEDGPKLFIVAPTIEDYIAFVGATGLDPFRSWYCRTVAEAATSMQHNAAHRTPVAVVVLAGHTLGFGDASARAMTERGAKKAAGDAFPPGHVALGYVDDALAGAEPGPVSYIVAEAEGTDR